VEKSLSYDRVQYTGFGGGGNITMRQEFVVQDESPIIAEAYGGPGGNIKITTTGIYQFSSASLSRISASSQFGVDGVVEIETPDNSAMEEVVILATDYLDVSGLLNTPCSQRIAEKLSSFIVVNSYGAPNSPNDFLPSGPLLAQLPTVNPRTSRNIDDSTDVFRNKLSMLKGCRNPL
jgi:large exoprotein involved in heme utilization and adhesion